MFEITAKTVKVKYLFAGFSKCLKSEKFFAGPTEAFFELFFPGNRNPKIIFECPHVVQDVFTLLTSFAQCAFVYYAPCLWSALRT